MPKSFDSVDLYEAGLEVLEQGRCVVALWNWLDGNGHLTEHLGQALSSLNRRS